MSKSHQKTLSKIEKINQLAGFELLIDIVYGKRRGKKKIVFYFKEAIFYNGKSLSKKEFGKFYRIIVDGRIQQAIAFISDYELFLRLETEVRRRTASAGGKAAMKDPNNHICNKSYVHWSKGSSGIGLVKAWNAGLTKETDSRCINISNSKRGNKNPMFGRPVTEETRSKISEKIKNRILNGQFTPCIHNSRTRKTLSYDGILFRSSWEALFHQAFPTAGYEALRIPYTINGKSHVFITDFILDGKVFEIKPQKFITLKKDKLEIVAEWCKSNGYKFIILDEFSLTELIQEHTVRYEDFDQNTQKLIRGLYESVAKRRNCKTRNGV
jgi:hypothetical protein